MCVDVFKFFKFNLSESEPCDSESKVTGIKLLPGPFSDPKNPTRTAQLT